MHARPRRILIGVLLQRYTLIDPAGRPRTHRAQPRPPHTAMHSHPSIHPTGHRISAFLRIRHRLIEPARDAADQLSSPSARSTTSPPHNSKCSPAGARAAACLGDRTHFREPRTTRERRGHRAARAPCCLSLPDLSCPGRTLAAAASGPGGCVMRASGKRRRARDVRAGGCFWNAACGGGEGEGGGGARGAVNAGRPIAGACVARSRGARRRLRAPHSSPPIIARPIRKHVCTSSLAAAIENHRSCRCDRES
ncbi:hypothetical protein FA95DRAFT_178287 [Auriscalpium vulgare]|uniref:Uncharacterized protein n=1 Tax=Auriscalpium vulgare TaxID=40419 RepID=A0ACB8RN05_9AGAM|nr:hypothetical protein FA95DRAFT_178287 [Auriscalpium vulgare]